MECAYEAVFAYGIAFRKPKARDVVVGMTELEETVIQKSPPEWLDVVSNEELSKPGPAEPQFAYLSGMQVLVTSLVINGQAFGVKCADLRRHVLVNRNGSEQVWIFSEEDFAKALPRFGQPQLDLSGNVKAAAAMNGAAGRLKR